MMTFRFARYRILLLWLVMMAAVASAQTQESKPYEPMEGQAGKDVIWLPTSQDLVDKMLDIAKVTPQDYLIDLGSGDGRLVITAAKRGARALGIEYNSDMVALSKNNAVQEGVADRAQFTQADLFESDFSQATVITMFLLPDINLKLRPKILNLKPGTRIVSNTFTMGDWQADQTANVEEGETCKTYCTALLWIVPEKVEGTWRLPEGDLSLKQSFQVVSGTLKSGAKTIPITHGRMSGDQLSFTAGNGRYTGRVNGNTIRGTVKSSKNTVPWSANRVGDGVQAPSKQ
jgi:hypothetical protein